MAARVCPSTISNLSVWPGFLTPFEKQRNLGKQDPHFHRTVGNWDEMVASLWARTCDVQLFTVPTTYLLLYFFTVFTVLSAWLFKVSESSELFRSCLSPRIYRNLLCVYETLNLFPPCWSRHSRMFQQY